MYRRATPTHGVGLIVLLRLLQEVGNTFRLPQGRRPYITLAVIALQIYIFFGIEGQSYLIRRFSFSGLHIIRLGVSSQDAWARMLGSQWLHLSVVHLGYNMLSLFSKGAQLEPSLGRFQFVVLLASLSVMAPVATLAIGLAADTFFDSPQWIEERAVGFSGVLFALKTIINFRADPLGHVDIFGIAVPTRLASWAELFLTQLFVPGTSFVGHLGGILAGLAWVGGVERIVFRALDCASMFGGDERAHANYFESTANANISSRRWARPRFYGSGVSGTSIRTRSDSPAHLPIQRHGLPLDTPNSLSSSRVVSQGAAVSDNRAGQSSSTVMSRGVSASANDRQQGQSDYALACTLQEEEYTSYRS